MPDTTTIEEWDAELEAAGADGAARVDVLERLLRACERDADLADEFDVVELHDQLIDLLPGVGRVDDALRHADALVALGAGMTPDPRCRRAELLMRAGRVDEAEPIWAAVRADTPDDVWLFNNAGIEYADVELWEPALEWLSEGIRIALRTGDEERLLGQLRSWRATTLTALGLPPDDLQRAEPVVRRMTPVSTIAATHPNSTRSTGWAWLPAADYVDVLDRMPELATSELLMAPDAFGVPRQVPHAEYCRRFEARLRAARDAGVTRMRVVGVRHREFAEWVDQHASDPDFPPDERGRRGEYVAEFVDDPGRSTAWPPGRNAPCWCGSERKYKKCCAAPA